jgi:aminopeptidase N
MLEARVGRERFDAFLRAYFDRFAFGSMDTPTFLAHLESELLAPAGLTLDDVDAEEWVHGTGVPAGAPEFASDAFDLVDAQVARLASGTPAADLDTEGWTSHQWVHLVRSLPTDHAVLDDVDSTYAFSNSGNIEVATAWFEHVVAAGWALDRPAADAALADLLTRHGRALYLRKVYTQLARTERGRARAREIYAVARPTYHPVSQGVVDKILA